MKFLKMLDYIFLLRPIMMVPFWTLYLLGYYQSLHFSGKTKFFVTSFSFEIFPLLFLGTMVYGIAYIINQIFDKETDKINNKLFFIPREIISVKNAYIESIILFLISGFCAYYFQISIQGGILLSALFIIIVIFYSVPPFRFKARPILDVLANSLAYGWIAFSLGWMIESPLSLESTLQSTPYFFSIAAVIINTTIVDMEGDQLNGINTTGVWLGKKKSSLISSILLFCVIILSIWQRNWVCLITAVVSFPFFLKAYITQKHRAFVISCQIAPGLFFIIGSIVFPYYFVFLGILFMITRWYYKKRFNFDYPSLG